MERPYIFFHTAAGFSVTTVGILIAFIAAFVVVMRIPAGLLGQLLMIFAAFAIGILPGFVVERWVVLRRRGRINDQRFPERGK